MPDNDLNSSGKIPGYVLDLFAENRLENYIAEFSEQMIYYNAAIKKINTSLEILDDEFHLKNDYNPIHHIETRLKSPKSIFDKLRRRGSEVNMDSIRELTDIAGIRVICNYIEDAYHIRDLLLSQNDISLVLEKDYIKNPKPSGYRSLHLILDVTVVMSTGEVTVPAEIQIRTIAMDYWATLEHRLKYKNKGLVPDDIHPQLRQCSDQLAEMETKMQEIHKRTTIQ